MEESRRVRQGQGERMIDRRRMQRKRSEEKQRGEEASVFRHETDYGLDVPQIFNFSEAF